MRILVLLLLFVFLCFAAASAQETILHPTSVVYAIKHDLSPPLRSMPIIPPAERGEEGEGREVPNHFFLFHRSQPQSIVDAGKDGDPVLQGTPGRLSPFSTIANFDGMTNTCGCYPPDPNADVGPNHVIETVNTSFAIYSKTGTVMLGPANLSTLWQSFPGPWTGSNDGDPVVRYDHLANRWLVSQFYVSGGSPFYELVAISQTADPTGSWYRYAFSFTNFDDYPKFGVWPDGYYMTSNFFNAAGTTYLGPGVAVFQRDSMLVGNNARMVFFQLASTHNPILAADLNGAPPAAGTPNTVAEATSGAMNFYTLTVNWTNTASSTFTGPVAVATAAFTELCSSTANCVPQQGTTRKLDGLGDRLMNRMQYRQFPSYQVLMASHTVDAGSTHAAVRWYEFRNTGSGWTVYQQATYSPDASHRWMGSIAMDGLGNIALGFSISSSSMYPSIRVTGRQATDPVGQMTFAEQSIIAGTGAQTGSASRWGDYTMMSVDPTDDQTFWYTDEYLTTTSTNSWRTRIASFKVSDLTPLPVQLVSFNGVATDNGHVRLEWRTISEVHNYGFYVERRYNDRTYFEELPGSFVAGHGTTNDPQAYSFVDNAASSTARFYRLRQVDLDGTIHYSEPISLNNLTGVQEPGPRQFMLGQNYPNPFNPSTEIKFTVAVTGRTKLEVFDILGQTVATLFDDVAESGQYYRVRFDAGRLASGVYFYRLQSGNHSDLKKLVFLR